LNAGNVQNYDSALCFVWVWSVYWKEEHGLGVGGRMLRRMLVSKTEGVSSKRVLKTGKLGTL
jgi:hypothetical protein